MIHQSHYLDFAHVAASVKDLLASLLAMQDPEFELSVAVVVDADAVAAVAPVLQSVSALQGRREAVCGSAVGCQKEERVFGHSRMPLVVMRIQQDDC